MNIKLNSGKNITLPEKPEKITVFCKINGKIALSVTHSKIIVDESMQCATLKLGAKCSCGEVHTASIARMADDFQKEYEKSLPTPDATKILLAPDPDYDE